MRRIVGITMGKIFFLLGSQERGNPMLRSWKQCMRLLELAGSIGRAWESCDSAGNLRSNVFSWYTTIWPCGKDCNDFV